MGTSLRFTRKLAGRETQLECRLERFRSDDQFGLALLATCSEAQSGMRRIMAVQHGPREALALWQHALAKGERRERGEWRQAARDGLAASGSWSRVRMGRRGRRDARDTTGGERRGGRWEWFAFWRGFGRGRRRVDAVKVGQVLGLFAG